MKKNRLRGMGVLLLTIMMGVITACNDDNDTIYEGYGMVNKQAEDTYAVTLDDGSVLIPQKSVMHPSDLRDSMRLYTHFTIKKQQENTTWVNFIYAHEITTKNVLPYDEAILDSIGNDPVKITRHWIAHGFLNFEFTYAGHYYISEENAHMINLLQHPDDNGKVILEFRHNAFGDARNKMYIGVVSFPIHHILEEKEKPLPIDIIYHTENSTETISLLLRR